MSLKRWTVAGLLLVGAIAGAIVQIPLHGATTWTFAGPVSYGTPGTGAQRGMAVIILDGNGDAITSFGGGTQYTEGDTDSTITGTALLWEAAANTLSTVTASTPLPIDLQTGDTLTTVTTVGTVTTLTGITNALPAGTNVIGHVIVDSGGGGGTQYTEDVTAAADPIGTTPILVRKDTPSATTSADGDNIAQRGTDYGAAYVTLLTSAGTVVALGSDQTLDAAIGTTGPLMVGQGSSTAPTAMSTNGDATALWLDLNGRLQGNVNQINGVTPLMGNGATGTGALRVSIASDSTGVVQPGNTANTTPWLVQSVPGAANGLTPYTLEPAASDNHANIKNGAGVVYHINSFNNSATVNYYRLYNAASGFNGCNSATNLIWEGHIPANTSDAGFIEDIAQGITFGTGISICVTGAYGQTNTTNATASAISLNIGYK